MKKLRLLTAVLLPAAAMLPPFYAADASPAGQATKPAAELRSRTLIDADWRFKLEPQIVVPSGPGTALITDWTVRESATGEADLSAILPMMVASAPGLKPTTLEIEIEK